MTLRSSLRGWWAALSRHNSEVGEKRPHKTTDRERLLRQAIGTALQPLEQRILMSVTAPTLSGYAVAQNEVYLPWTATSGVNLELEEKGPNDLNYKVVAHLSAISTTSGTFDIAPLSASTLYSFRLRADDGTDENYSSTATVQTWDYAGQGDPGSGGVPAPTNVHQSVTDAAWVSFQWSSSLNPGGGDMELVPDIQSDAFGLGTLGGGSIGGYSTSGGTTTETEYQDQAGAQTYNAFAQFENGTGLSPWSSPGTVVVSNDLSTRGYRPDAPIGLAASTSGSNTTFTWTIDDASTIPYDETVTYKLYGVTNNNQLYSPDPLDSSQVFDGSSTTYSVTLANGFLPSDIKQVFVVANYTRADYGGFSNYSNYVKVNGGPSVPATPALLNATAVFDGSGNLSDNQLLWDNTPNNESGYTIQRSVNSANWTTIATVGADVTQYTDSSLPGDGSGHNLKTYYYYRVQAFNATGPSGWINTLIPICPTCGGVVNHNGWGNSATPSIFSGSGINWGQSATVGNNFAFTDGAAGSGSNATGMPFLILYNQGSIAAIYGANDASYFDPDGSGGFVESFGGTDTLTHGSGTFTLTDASGTATTYYDFSTSVASNLQGKFKSKSDASGNQAVVATANAAGQATEVDLQDASSTITEKWMYAYGTDGLLTSVTQQQHISGTWTSVRVVNYAYWDGTNSDGSVGDLKSVVITDGSSNEIDQAYYRYYVSGDTGGVVHQLKYSFGADSYARLKAAYSSPDSATNSQIAPYADAYMEYDSQNRVTTRTLQGAGCSACSGGQGTSTYSYTSSGNAPGVNSWATKVVETQPDSNEDITYYNSEGQVMLSVYHDTTSGQMWGTFYEYDSAGRQILMADPSAVALPSSLSTIEAYSDLLHKVSGNYYYLNDSTGNITLTDYASTTTATSSTAGNVMNYLEDEKIAQGETATAILQSSMDYIAHTGGSQTIYLVADSSVYRNTDGTGAETTSYSYTFYSGSVQMYSQTMSKPIVTTAQNGPNSADTDTTIHDTYGRVIWEKDPDGYITYTAYDQATGAVVKTIQDVNTSDTSDFSSLPSGWTTPTGGGSELITAYQVDSLGRVTKTTDPNGNVTFTVYKDDYNATTGFVDEVRTYSGWHYDSVTGEYAVTGPVTVTRYNRDNSYNETLTYMPGEFTTTTPDGSDTITNIQTLSRDYISAGGQMVESDRYFNLSGLTYSSAANIGTAGTNYYATLYGYDHNGNQNKVVSPTGTITRTVYDGQGRVVSTWVGTNDTPGSGYWSPSNAAGMTQVSANIYDGGGIGDGNLTQTIQYVDSTTADNRVSLMYYDWRNRLVAEKDGALLSSGTPNPSGETDGVNRQITYAVYDNLNEVTEQDIYAGDGVSISSSGGVPVAPSSGLQSSVISYYDNQGRVYRTQSNANGTGTSATIGSLTNSTPYYFSVAALTGGSESDKGNIVGLTPTSSASATGVPVLGKPVQGASQVTLNWNAISGVTGYKVYMGTSPTSLSLVDTVSSTSDTITSLDSSTTYYFAVASYSGSTIGNKSDIQSGSPLVPANLITNGNFDATTVSGQATAPSGTGWNYSGSGTYYAGIEAGGYWTSLPSVDGNQAGYVRGGTGNSLSQTVNLAAGTYDITFYLGGYESLDFKVDGTQIGDTLAPASVIREFTSFTEQFTIATAGSHTISFNADDNNASNYTAIDRVSLSAAPPNLINDGSFEHLVMSSGGYEYNPTGGSWTFANQSGITDDGSAWNAANGQDGVQVAFLQSNSTGNPLSSVSETLSLDAGTYNLSFYMATRSGDPVDPVTLKVDGTAVGSALSAQSNTFTQFTESFTISSSGSHSISFSVPDESYDTSTFLDNVVLNRVFSSGGGPTNLLADASFESPSVGSSSYSYNPTGTDWSFNNGTGIESNGSGWLGPDAPDGTQAAFLQSNGLGGGLSQISQSVSLDAGTYNLSFYLAWRLRYPIDPVRVDGDDIGTYITPLSSDYFTQYSENFTVSTSGTHTITFSVPDESYDTASFLDNVSLVQLTPPAQGPVTITGGTSGNGSATLDWSAVAGATGYKVYWGTSPTSLTNVMTVGGSLTSNTYYDARGNVIEQVAADGQATKTSYDGAGRAVKTSTTDGGTINSPSTAGTWTAASSTSNDVVAEQTLTYYDKDGDVTETIDKQRLPTDSDSSTGDLGGPTSGVEARDYYSGSYYDAADRDIEDVNVGTDGGSSWTRPSTATDSANNRSDTVLVTTTTYNDMGMVDTVTDPRGIVSKTYYDNAGRTIKTIADYTDGTPTDSSNQTTEYTYDGDDHTLTMKADLPSSAFQTTEYIYGVTTSGGSFVNSNDLLAEVEYPDLSSGSPSSSAANDVTYVYNGAGQVIQMTDRNGDVHAYTYDSLGRLTLDAVTTLGSGVDGSMRALGYSYNAQGLAYQQTSYDSATNFSSGHIVNQVQNEYNNLGQLIGQYQSVSGAVNTSTTLEVQYVYGDPSQGSLLTEMIYPNGRILHYFYNSGLDAVIGRLSGEADDDGTGGIGQVLEAYSYLGASTIVQENRPQAGIELTYLQQSGDSHAITDGGDEVTGLDRFGRVIDQNWITTSTGTSTDRFQYGYDRDGNVLYENNLVDPSLSELFHANSSSTGDDSTAYDGLNRLVAFCRGTLTASGNNGSVFDTVSSGNLSSLSGSTQSWNLNSVGDQSSKTIDGSTMSNSFNSHNEQTASGSNSLTFDNAGDMTTDENGLTYTYDAWNHLISAKSGATAVASYSYDANGHRITQTESGATTILYIDPTNGNFIEERQGGSVTIQQVWGATYINELILRDDNSTYGDLGANDSGLGRRLYTQYDENWNITNLVSSSGIILQRATYAPYGSKIVLNVAGTSSVADAYVFLSGFQGGSIDQATGLYLFNSSGAGRDYDPIVGTWREPDRAGYKDGSDQYNTEHNDPANTVDPLGLSPPTMPRPRGSSIGGPGRGGAGRGQTMGANPAGSFPITPPQNSAPQPRDILDGPIDGLSFYYGGGGGVAHLSQRLIDELKQLPWYSSELKIDTILTHLPTNPAEGEIRRFNNKLVDEPTSGGAFDLNNTLGRVESLRWDATCVYKGCSWQVTLHCDLFKTYTWGWSWNNFHNWAAHLILVYPFQAAYAISSYVAGVYSPPRDFPITNDWTDNYTLATSQPPVRANAPPTQSDDSIPYVPPWGYGPGQ